MFDRLLTLAAWTVPDGRWRAEVVEVAQLSSSGEGRVGRARELAGVASFGLRLRSAHATDGRPTAAWRQGAVLGSLLVLTAGLADQLAAGVSVSWPAAGGTLAIAAALVASAYGRPALTAAVAAVAALVLTTGQPAGAWSPVHAACLVAVGASGLATWRAHGPREQVDPRGRGGHDRRGWARWAGPHVAPPGGRWWTLALLGPAAALIAGGGAMPVTAVTAVTAVATLVVPVVLVAGGAVDARLAAAAVVAWGWRFLAVDPTDALAAVAAVGSHELDAMLVRLVAMAWAVGLAVVVTQRAARRTSAL